MRKSFPVYFFAAVAALGLSSTGCTTLVRVPISIDRHPTAPVMHMEANYWKRDGFYGTLTLMAHEFWTCREQGDHVVCQRQCGGKLELACPGVSGRLFGE
jgi:hypothetical protein